MTASRFLAFGTALAVSATLGLIPVANANQIDGTTYTAAAHADLLTIGSTAAGEANANDDNRGPNTTTLDAAALTTALTTANHPGLITLGTGEASATAAAPSYNSATASANGAAGVTIDATSLLGSLNTPAFDSAKLTVGAASSTATDSGKDVTGDYTLKSLGLDLHSATLTSGLDALVNTAVAPISALATDGGTIDTAVQTMVDALDVPSIATVTIDPSTTISGLDNAAATVRQGLEAAPFSNEAKTVTVNLKDGTVHVDLGAIVAATLGKSLEDQPANTELLTPAVEAAVRTAVAQTIAAKATELLNAAISAAQVSVVVNVNVKALFLSKDFSLTVNSTLGEAAAGKSTWSSPQGESVSVMGYTLGKTDIDKAVATATGNIGKSISPLLKPTINLDTDSVLGTTGALNTLLGNLLSLEVNDQPTTGDLGAESFTVRALTATLLPNAAQKLSVEVASSTVKASENAPVTPTETTTEITPTETTTPSETTPPSESTEPTEPTEPTTEPIEPTEPTEPKTGLTDAETVAAVTAGLMMLAPVGLFLQLNVPGVQQWQASLSQQIQDANTRLQQQAGIFNPELASWVEDLNTQLNSPEVSTAIGGAGLVLAGLLVGKLIAEGRFPQQQQEEPQPQA